MALRLLAGKADHRYVQMLADDLGDLAERNAFVTDRIQPRARGRRLQRQPEQMSGVESVHRGPPVGPVLNVGRQALRAGDAYEGWDEAMITPAMHRQRHADRRDANPASGEQHGHWFRDPRIR